MGVQNWKKSKSAPGSVQPEYIPPYAQDDLTSRRLPPLPSLPPAADTLILEDVVEYDQNSEAPLQTNLLEDRLIVLRNRLEFLEQHLNLVEEASEKSQIAASRVEKSKAQALDWLGRVQSSFVWQLKAALASERAFATAQMKHMEQDVSNVALPEKGVLASLQAKFVSRFGKSWIAPVLIMSLVFLIPWAFTVPRIPQLAALYNPETAGPILVGLILLLLGISALIVYLLNRERFPVAKFFIWVALVAFAGLLIFQLSFLEPWLKAVLAPWLAANFLWFLLASTVILVASILGVLISYYSKWSQFRRTVDLQLTSLQNVVRGYIVVKQELKRLESLHAQAEDWLSLLASAIHRPWKVDPRWLEESRTSYDLEHTPSALRVARAIDSGDSKTSALERTIAEKLLVRGWRKDAFEEMVTRIGSALGSSPSGFSVETLDNDLPHLPNNHRKIVSAFLNQTAANEAVGSLDFSNPTSDPMAPGGVRSTDKYLMEIGKDRIRTLLRDAQMSTIKVQRPDVEPISRKAGLSFDFDETGFEESQTRRSWDEFLSESLGTVDEAQPPLSPMVFTIQGKSQRLHEQVQSYLIAPARIESTIPSVKSSTIKVVSSGAAKPRRVEIIARVDVSSAVSLDSLTLFSDEDSQENLLSSSLGAPVANTCFRCGYIDCDASKDETAKCSQSGRF